MKPRERRAEWRRDIRRRKVAATEVVLPDDWSIEFATRSGAYTEQLHTHRFIVAIRAFNDLEITDGQRKRLLRNGRVIERVIAPRSITSNHQVSDQGVLPIAL